MCSIAVAALGIFSAMPTFWAMPTAVLTGMATEAGNGETALVGPVRDQAHLYGILERLRDFGLELLRVEEGAP